jgi:uncharacterized protein YaiI (UPF0178 family)
MSTIYVDADACPVKQEIYTAADKRKIPVVLVANQSMRAPANVTMQVVTGSFDAADDWIAENAGPGDIVITADILLANRALARGAWCLSFKGSEFEDAGIGDAVAKRNLMEVLRNQGFGTEDTDANRLGRGNPPFGDRERREFRNGFYKLLDRMNRRPRAVIPPPPPPDDEPEPSPG